MSNVKAGNTYLFKDLVVTNYYGKIKIVKVRNDGQIEIELLDGDRKGQTRVLERGQWDSADKIKQSGGKRKSRKTKGSRKHKTYRRRR